MPDERFFTVAMRETEYWDAAALAEINARDVFGLYLIREGERTHICSLTPNSRAEWLGNRFIVDLDEEGDEPWIETRHEYENDPGGETVSYFGFIDPAKRDPRFIAGPIEIDYADEGIEIDAEDPRRLTDEETESLWTAAREYWDASPDEPKITWGGAEYEAWEAEQRAKRRAENRSPLDRRDPLPLFAAVAHA